MTVQELYDYAKKHNALDYEIHGTSMCCGPYFDLVKLSKERKVISVEDSANGYSKEYYKENGFYYIPKH